MYKVFFNDRVIRLYNDINEVSGMQDSNAGECSSYRDMKSRLDYFFAAGNDNDLDIYHDDLEELYRHFQSYFRFIHAAGGLVRNDNEESLFIFRRGKWDLPKGKPEKGEQPEQTAIREVEEECNIQGVAISRFIASTFHIYYLKKDIVLKRTDWFEMTYKGDQDPAPYEKEEITGFKWLPDDQVNAIEDNTYPAILEVINAYQKIR